MLSKDPRLMRDLTPSTLVLSICAASRTDACRLVALCSPGCAWSSSGWVWSVGRAWPFGLVCSLMGGSLNQRNPLVQSTFAEPQHLVCRLGKPMLSIDAKPLV